jgi:signal transduction histidine kinase
LNVTGAPVYNYEGNQIGAICVYRDVTERRRLERRTQDALNALLAMAEALVQIPDQQQYGRLSDSPFPELISRLLDMMQPPFIDQPNPYGMRNALLAPMFVGDQLVGILALDYGGVEHEYTPEETALAGAIAKLAALVIERERLLYEQAKAQANELALREAQRRMDEFLGMAGHELRTPLTAISGNIQMAQRQVKKSIDENGTYAGDLPGKLEMIRSLLDGAKRQVRLQNRLVGDLVAIVRDAVQDQRILVPARSIRLHVPSEAAVPVVADADRISQVVTNYLTNALKYSEADRPIEVFLAVEGQMATSRTGWCPEFAGRRVHLLVYPAAGARVNLAPASRGVRGYIDILPRAIRRGLPPSRVGFPASLETAIDDCIRLYVLRRLHRYMAFRKPCGSFSVY